MAEIPGSPPASGALANILGHLAHIPAMVGAVARLIGKTASIGEAWLDVPVAEGERRAQAIRDDTAARSALMKIMQEAAGETASHDPALIGRAVMSWAGERLRKQTNKEEVARKAIEFTILNPPKADAAAPNEDWMSFFESYAEKASSEEMRSIWGKVLAGEYGNQAPII